MQQQSGGRAKVASVCIVQEKISKGGNLAITTKSSMLLF